MKVAATIEPAVDKIENSALTKPCFAPMISPSNKMTAAPIVT